jgi:hypothetical protein
MRVSPRARRGLVVAGVVLGVVTVTLVRSASLLGYSNWIIDEHFIVAIALGFIGFDLDPLWYNYFPLPMYLLGDVYFLMYLGARALGLVASKPEFTALLFSHDAAFYVPAKLLGSLAYTGGCAVLGLIAWRRTSSRAAAALAFAAPLLLVDGIATATNIRNDTFVFLFAALTVYFSCFARKTLASVVLAAVFCAAALASKLPALVLVPVLFARLAWDARRGDLKWRHVAIAAGVLPVALFAFMPFAFLEPSAYLPMLKRATARVAGEWTKVGKETLTGPGERWANLMGALYRNSGALPLAGTAAYLAHAAWRDRTALFAALFPLAYVCAFSTSSVFDDYWLRPVYPFLLLFPILAVWDLAALPRVRAAPYGRAPVLLAVLALGYVFTLAGNVPKAARAMVPPPEDTRVTAARWIGGNLPAGSRVVLEGYLPHYWPRVFSPRPEITLAVHQYSYPWVMKKDVLMDGFRYWFMRALGTERPFRVVPMMGNARIGYDMARMHLLPGDYVVLSRASYARYYGPAVTRDQPELARNAQAFFAFVRAQEPVRTFTGNGPAIEIYRMKEGLNAPERGAVPEGSK